MVVSCSEILEVLWTVVEVSGDKKHNLAAGTTSTQISLPAVCATFSNWKTDQIKIDSLPSPDAIPLKFLECPVPLLKPQIT